MAEAHILNTPRLKHIPQICLNASVLLNGIQRRASRRAGVYEISYQSGTIWDLRVTVVVVDLHERHVADALVEDAVHSIANVWVRCH